MNQSEVAAAQVLLNHKPVFKAQDRLAEIPAIKLELEFTNRNSLMGDNERDSPAEWMKTGVLSNGPAIASGKKLGRLDLKWLHCRRREEGASFTVSSYSSLPCR